MSAILGRVRETIVSVDVGVLTATIMTSFLLPYVKMGLHKIAEKVTEQASSDIADEATQLTKKVWMKVRDLFVGDDAQRLDQFEQTKGEENRDLVEVILKDKLRNHSELVVEMNALISPPATSPSNAAAQIMKAHIAGIINIPGGNFSGASNISITAVSVNNSSPKAD